MKNAVLAETIAAHWKHLRASRRFECAAAIVDVAVTLAIQAHGVDERKAVAFLEACAVPFPKWHYTHTVKQLLREGETCASSAAVPVVTPMKSVCATTVRSTRSSKSMGTASGTPPSSPHQDAAATAR